MAERLSAQPNPAGKPDQAALIASRSATYRKPEPWEEHHAPDCPLREENGQEDLTMCARCRWLDGLLSLSPVCGTRVHQTGQEPCGVQVGDRPPAAFEQCAPWCLNGPGGPRLGCNCGAEARNAAQAVRSSSSSPSVTGDTQ